MTFPLDAARSMWRLQLSDGRVLPITETEHTAPLPRTCYTHEATVELGGNILRVGATNASAAREKIAAAVVGGFGVEREARLVPPGEAA